MDSTPTSPDGVEGETHPTSTPATIMEGSSTTTNDPAVSTAQLSVGRDDEFPTFSGPMMNPEAPGAANESHVPATFDGGYADMPEEMFVPQPWEEPARFSSQKMVGKDFPVPGPPETNKNEDGKRDVEEGRDGFVKNKSSTKKSKKKKPEINSKFKDVQETGNWGEMPKRELYIAASIFCVILVVVLTVVGVVVSKNDGDSEASADGVQYIPAPTRAPTMPPTSIPIALELALVRDDINLLDATVSLLDDLPTDAAFYEGLADVDATPQQKAMAWLLYQDQLKDPAESATRWALASIYFQMGGPGWTSSEGWLGNDSFCTWEHISCDRGTLQEIDLEENNVTGNIALEFALLGSMQSIFLRRNKITGTIPASVFVALPRLGLLYLDNNLLNGTVPAELLDNGDLRTYGS
jgi:hypothetical protein